MMPNWLGIGCVKCGTSWTWQQMRKHPQIFTPKGKEIHFWNSLPTKDMSKYAKLFDNATANQVAGEFTPDYFHHYEAMHNIKEYCPDIKLITLFRHPVERSFSNWKHAVQEGRLSKTSSFNDSFSFWRVRERSIYSRWLKRWWKLFPKEQIKIMWYEDIKTKPLQFLQEIFQFLGVDDKFVPSDYEEHFDFHYHHNDKLAQAKLSNNDRKTWLEYYKPHTEELEKLTGRDLSNWKI
jgi:hypothetical protein